MTLSNAPGVYRMLDEAGNALYVGKAKSLKKRVYSYTQTGKHPARLLRMIAETRTMEFVVTRSEVEALLLEANLIKRLMPRYNVLLRSEEHTSELQSLMRISYAVFCLKKKNTVRRKTEKHVEP